MKIRIEFECGETTCASEPGKFCRFLRVGWQGESICDLFHDNGGPTKLFDEGGWVQRCSECMKLGSNG